MEKTIVVHQYQHRRLSRPELCEYSPVQKFRSQIRTFFLKLIAGDSPPKSHYSMIALIALDIICSLSLFVVCTLSHFHLGFIDYNFPSGTTLVSLAMLMSGLYEAWLLGCCWKRVHGYDWWMIPHF